MKKTLCTRAVSLVLALLMVITVFPMTAREASAAAYTGIMHQIDQIYLNYRYDDSSLYSAGCGIFSLANAVGCLTGQKIDVVEVADWGYSKGYFNGKVGTYSTIYSPASQRFGPVYGFSIDANTSGKGYYGTINDARIKNHLMNGGTVIVHVPNHYMALVGYNAGSDLYHVYDSSPDYYRGTFVDYDTSRMGDAWLTPTQLSTERGKVDWYCLVSPAPVDSEKPVISDIKITDVSYNGYTVSCTVTDNHEIQKVAFPTWTLANDQDDLDNNFMTTQLGTQNGNTFTYRVNTSAHNYEDGYYVTNIYAVDRKGNTAEATAGNIQVPEDPRAPVISDVEYTEVSAAGYTISCTVTDELGIQSVSFPTWTEANGQDDLQWYSQGSAPSGTRYSCRINASNHNGETGVYTTHIYATNVHGTQTTLNLPSVKVMNDTQAPVITDAEITNISTEGYTVTCRVTDNWGVHTVAFPTWTIENGQDDLADNFMNTQKGTKNGDFYTFRVNASDHNGEGGFYLTHIYAKDSAGNVVSLPLDEVELVDGQETWREKACFDATVYRARYSELSGLTDEELKEHWLTTGIQEGRTASVVLDLKYYLDNNPDLAQKYGTDYAALYTQFITAGYKEHRKSSPAFDGQYYVDNHADVAQSYPTNYLKHYVESGMAQGRRASATFDPDYYWYSQLSVSMGDADYTSCVKHYMSYGAPQGITAYDNEAPVISDVTVSKINSSGYTITCTITDNWTVEDVSFPTWTVKNDQDDLTWYADQWTKDGDTYTLRINTSNHNNEKGMYITHIYAQDKVGNQTSFAVNQVEVTDSPKLRLNSGTTSAIESGLLTKVKPNTKVSVLLGWFANEGTMVVRDKNGNALTGSDKVSTDCTVELYIDGDLSDTLTVAVPGDVDGNGTVDTTDYMRVKGVLLGTISLTEAQRKAADVDGNKSINTTDYVRIKAYLMGIFDIYS